MARLLSHDHPDLHRGSIVFVININSLVGTSCDLIIGGMTTLEQDVKSCELLLKLKV